MLNSLRSIPTRDRFIFLAAVFLGSPVLLAGCGTVGARASATRPASSRRQHVVPGPLGVPGRWRLLLNADFATKSLNTRIWRPGWFANGISGPVNKHEVACYNSQNVALTGTTLNLSITRVPSTCGGKTRPYTGAMVSTNPHDGRTSGGFTYTYGLAEARIYFPPNRRLIADWPAFSTFGQDWPTTGEDDILEGIAGTGCSRFHSRMNSITGFGGCDPGFTPGWHTIAADWQPNSITWYYDGIKVFHDTVGLTSAPMYLVLVNTVSVRYPQLAMPDTLKVAYVRVWQPAGPALSHPGYAHSF